MEFARLFLNVRFFLLLTLCLVVALVGHEPRTLPTVVKTGNELDVAIIGPGYLSVCDPNDGIHRYTRSGSLRVDAYGVLGVQIGAKFLVLTDGVSIPADTDRIAILPDGQVLVFGPWSFATAVGQICLYGFSASHPFSNPYAANQENETTGSPVPANDGLNGHLQQYWVERPPWPLPATFRGVCLAILASILLNQLWLISTRS